MEYDRIIHKLKEYHHGRHEEGIKFGEKIFEQIVNGKINPNPHQLSLILDSYYVNAFYYNKNLARKIAQYYINRALEDPIFYKAYEVDKDHIKNNFSHCGLRVPDRDGTTEKAYPLTLVTGIFDLGSREDNTKRRSIKEYLEYGEFTLALDCALIIYIEPEYVEYVTEKRKLYGLESKTVIIPKKLEDLEFYAEAERIKHNRKINPIHNACPNKDTYLYMVVIWSKFKLLKESIKNNPFKSTHIAWIDFGLAHVAKTDNVKSDNIFPKTFAQCWIPDKIRIQKMMIWHSNLLLDWREYFSYIRGNICAGYFTGSLDNVSKLCDMFIELANECLDKGFAPSEEQILPLIIEKNLDMFDMYYGDYTEILNNYKYHRGSIDLNLTNLRACMDLRNYSIARDIWVKLYTDYKKGHCILPDDFFPWGQILNVKHHEVHQVLMAKKSKLAIGVFSTSSINKYVDQILACANTWCQTAKEYNIPVYFFGGYFPFIEEHPNIDYVYLTSELKINGEPCPNVGEDILSPWDKHFYALKWLYYNTSAKYHMIIGSDTFVNIPNLYNCLSQYNPDEHLYLGGIRVSPSENFVRQLDNKNILFLSGGSGIIHTERTTTELMKKFNEIMINWKPICIRNNNYSLFGACDVTVAYYMHKLGISPTINDMFNPYKHDGKDMDDLITCHYMEPEDMEEYHKYLLDKKSKN